ncbi:hypothetical protein, partial [Vibrio azureus]
MNRTVLSFNILHSFLLVVVFLFAKINVAYAQTEFSELYNENINAEIIMASGGYIHDLSSDHVSGETYSDLNIPSGANVVKAWLFWGTKATSLGNWTTGDSRATANLKVPGASTFQVINADWADAVWEWEGSGFRADITTIVQNAGSGSYSVKDLYNDSTSTSNKGGWTIVAIVQGDEISHKNITIHSGLKYVGSSAVDIHVDDILTPTGGSFEAKALIVGYGGASGYGNALTLSSSTTGASAACTDDTAKRVSDALNPANDVLNGSYTVDGVAQTTSHTIAEWDSDLIDISSLLPNSATNLCFRDSGVNETGQGGDDWANLLVLGVETEVQPELDLNVWLAGLTGTAPYPEPGSQVLFWSTITVQSERVENLKMSSTIPPGLTYVNGSLASNSALTDTLDGDVGYFDSLTNTVHINLGQGATGTTGGTLPVNEAQTFSFKVSIDSDANINSVINTDVQIDYDDSHSGQAYTPIVNTYSIMPRSTLPVADDAVSDGSIENPFTSFYQSKSVTEAGVYYFYTQPEVNSNAISSYVDENGWILTASGVRQASASLSYTLDIRRNSNSFLFLNSPRVNELRLSGVSVDDVSYDWQTDHPVYLERYKTKQTLGGYLTGDVGRGVEWLGTGGGITASCDTTPESIVKKVWDSCGEADNLYWHPSAQDNGFKKGENYSDNSLWVRFSPLVAAIDEITGNADGVDMTAEEINWIEGVAGALAENQSYYQSFFQASTYVDASNPTAAELQAAIDAANNQALLDKVAEDIAGNSDTVAVTAEQINLIVGVSGAVAENEALYTAAFPTGSYAVAATPTAEEIQMVIDSVNGLVTVSGVTSGTVTGVTVTADELNGIAGVSSADAANESLYAGALANGTYADSSNPTAEEIQAVIDSVNSLETVSGVTSGTVTGVTITAEDLNAIEGVSGADAANESLYADALANGTYADSSNPTPEEIQAVIDSVNSLETVSGVTSGTVTGVTITAEELNAIEGVSGADAANESLYADALANGTYADSSNPTAEEIQAVIDSVNSLETVSGVTSGTVTGVTITADELNAIEGVSGADAANESLYTDALANGTYADSSNPTAEEIQAVVDAVNTSEENLDTISDITSGSVTGSTVTAEDLNAIEGV